MFNLGRARPPPKKTDMEENNERTRKGGTPHVVTQKMMSFRVDLVVAERLQQEKNKGRLINWLLRKHYGIDES